MLKIQLTNLKPKSSFFVWQTDIARISVHKVSIAIFILLLMWTLKNMCALKSQIRFFFFKMNVLWSSIYLLVFSFYLVCYFFACYFFHNFLFIPYCLCLSLAIFYYIFKFLGLFYFHYFYTYFSFHILSVSIYIFFFISQQISLPLTIPFLLHLIILFNFPLRIFLIICSIHHLSFSPLFSFSSSSSPLLSFPSFFHDHFSLPKNPRVTPSSFSDRKEQDAAQGPRGREAQEGASGCHRQGAGKDSRHFEGLVA